jgi:hypothetical protein
MKMLASVYQYFIFYTTYFPDFFDFFFAIVAKALIFARTFEKRTAYDVTF